jgi:hypothetical protein
MAFAFQLSFLVLKSDVHHGKIIETRFSIQLLEMVPWFPVPIPGIVFLTAAPIFLAAFVCIFKIGRDSPAVIPYASYPACWIQQNTGMSRV